MAKTKGHRPQLGTYELLYENDTGVSCSEPAGIIGMKTSGSPEIAVGEVSNAKSLLIGTHDSPGYIEIAAEIFRSGLFTPNPQSILCSPAYCPRWNACPYHD